MIMASYSKISDISGRSQLESAAHIPPKLPPNYTLKETPDTRYASRLLPTIGYDDELYAYGELLEDT